MQTHQDSRLQQVSAAAGFVIVALQTSDKWEMSEEKLSTREHKQIYTFRIAYALPFAAQSFLYIMERHGLILTELAYTGAICLAVRFTLPAASAT